MEGGYNEDDPEAKKVWRRCHRCYEKIRWVFSEDYEVFTAAYQEYES